MKTEKFSERLRQAMQIRNLTAAQICAESGIAKGTMSEYLSGKYEAKNERLYLLSQVLDCDPRWLEGKDVPMQSPKDNDAQAFMLDVFYGLEAADRVEPAEKRSAPPEFCDGRHFWLKFGGETESGLLLCRRQGLLMSGQTGIFLDSQDNALMLRCEQRRNAVCLIEVNGAGRVFINEDAEGFRLAARVLQRVQDL